jgi:UDP-GlcNAc:undecaprenyl-phosphate GlcNAc-1-phosphate transferase
MGDYLVVFALAAVSTYLFTFPLRRLAVRFGSVVQPDERRVHERPTPTLGGIAMYAGFALALGLTALLSQFSHLLPSVQQVFRLAGSEPLGVALGGAVILLVGVVDDIKEVSPPAKLAGQVLAATILYFFGVTLSNMRIPFHGVVVLSPSITPLLTAVWVAVMANAINFIDGLDGLAAGIVAIAAGAFFVYSERLSVSGLIDPSNAGPLIAALAVGVCVGFLPHNFHRAKVFMGDAGALFLGLLMASSTMLVGGQQPANQSSGETYFFFAPLFIPFVILGVPILDTLFAIVRRTARRASVATPDKDHLHHRLMRLGHGHRRAVLILWAWTAILSGLVLYPTFTNGKGNALIPFGIAGLGIALFTLFRPGLGRRPAHLAGPDG